MFDKYKMDNKVTLKEEYYSDKISNYFILLILGVVLIFSLLIVKIYIDIVTPKPQFFEVNSNNQIFTGEPLDEPLFNEPQIKDRAAQLVIRLLDFNFLNYETIAQHNKKLFTNDGFNKYIDFLKKIGIGDIVKNKYIINANLCDVVNLNKEKSGLLDINNQKTYTWTFNLPIVARYINKDKQIKMLYEVGLVINRMSELEYLDGLAINDLKVINSTNITSGSSGSLNVCNG